MSETLMPFLVTATDPGGRRETFARDAASTEHLRNVLEREGFTDIELIDDDLSARLRKERPAEGRPRRFQATPRAAEPRPARNHSPSARPLRRARPSPSSARRAPLARA